MRVYSRILDDILQLSTGIFTSVQLFLSAFSSYLKMATSLDILGTFFLLTLKFL